MPPDIQTYHKGSTKRIVGLKLYRYDEEADEQVNEFRRLVEGLQGLIEKQIRITTRDLIAIKTCIQYDSLRVTSGVDIVRFYYDNRKRCPKGKVEYQFKIMHQHPMKTRKED